MRIYNIKLLLSIILIVIGIVLFSCENDINVVKSLQVDESLPIETTYGVESLVMDSGKVRISIKSPQIDRYEAEEEYIEMKKGVDVTFFDSLGNITSSIRADYAINTPEKKIIIAKYNVIATNQNGEKLFTEELTWDQKTKKIYTNMAVKVESDDKVIFGDGLVANETFNNWQIKNPRGDIETEGIGDEEE